MKSILLILIIFITLTGCTNNQFLRESKSYQEIKLREARKTYRFKGEMPKKRKQQKWRVN
jgi:uncharacterized lipoprotein YehR (DUF1307 family)